MISIKTYGSSMFPFFHDKDIVFLKKISFAKIKINDFVTFKKNDCFVTHRVIFKNQNYVITKGDNNLKTDGKIHPKDIVGKVWKIKRKNQIINPLEINLFQSTYYFDEINKFNNELKKRKIDYVFLKGLPIHLHIERTHPKRIYSDCDILINEKNKEEVFKILEKFGYKKSNMSLSKLHGLIKKNHREIVFYKIINNSTVIFDVHFQAVSLMQQIDNIDSLYPQKLNNKMTKKLLLEKRFVKIRENTFPILSNENLVFFLAMHLFHHNFKGYFRYELLSDIIKKSKPDWKILSKIIMHFKANNFVYPIFIILQKKYMSPIPSSFLHKIKPAGNVFLYLQKKVLNIDIFEDETRFSAGIERFKHLFFLSPNSFLKRTMIFLNPQVIYSVGWSIGKRIIYFLRLLRPFSPRNDNR